MTIPGYRETWILLPCKATICEETKKITRVEVPSYPECDEAVEVFGEFEDKKETMSWIRLLPAFVKLLGRGWFQ